MQSHRPLIDIARSARRAAMVMVSMLGGFLLAGAGLLAFPSIASASTCSGPLSAGEIRVVMVVDMGDGGSSSSVCLVVPEGTTGSQLIARRAAEIGAASPRYAGSGLLCAIDGFPATGCGDRNAGGFAYWAYFSGAGGSWQYGNYNPFVKRLRDGDIEGWRYVNGAGDGQDPAPRTWPSTSLFPPLAAPVIAAPARTGPSVGAGASSAPSPESSSTPAAADPDGADATGDTSATPSAPAGSSSETSTTVLSGDVADVALASSTNAGASDVGRWIGVIAIAVLIGGFGAGAWFRSRRTS